MARRDVAAALHIRHGEAGDTPALETIYRDAFPDEDLLPLVRDLLRDASQPLSLVATRDGEIIGHAVFTACRVVDEQSENASLLGPLAVAVRAHKQGVGTALVRAGLERLAAAGVARVFVLGDPTYYGRFGFRPEASIAPPYPLPSAWTELWAWRSMSLRDGAPRSNGTLQVPPVWDDPALWRPAG